MLFNYLEREINLFFFLPIPFIIPCIFVFITHAFTEGILFKDKIFKSVG